MNRAIYSASHINDMEQRYRAEFINSLSGFKSANLVGTQSRDGQQNLAIVSSVVHIGANPPLLGMIMRPHTVQRDTLENIKDTGVYTLNNVTSSMTRAAHQTSARYAQNESEFAAVGLTPEASTAVAAPYVAESTICMSLEVQDIQFIPINRTELVIGQIVEVILPEKSIDKTGYIDIEQCDSISISGLVSYHLTKRIARYGYAKPDQELINLHNSEGETE
ncbi:flavin reductase [Alteromonas sp. ASW11-36]|uniref:Flavin reductase n=1 Tax=Alteromonas arenosi TaxID=3055817 RepID=A0ABT7T181_9ALTE|nr:flavin reductase [Alteromonas sp. ASW11-36]MDM7862209.1 flavin reductase [Alteromonas sp. ASW11-36]